MSSFTDEEDRALVQFVIQQEEEGPNRISWVRIANTINTKKSPEQLRLRLAGLKKRFGNDLTRFPRWYHIKKLSQAFTHIPTKTICRRVKTKPKNQLLSPLSKTESYVAVEEIFASVEKADVRQQSGKTESNAGELTPTGTTAMIEACALKPEDVFIDVGSGIGNVVAQVALQTNVLSVVGVEIREGLARQGEMLMAQYSERYPQLRKVSVYPQDICDIYIANMNVFQTVTVLFSHNTVFKPEALLVLESICCRLPQLRTVVLMQPFCTRHRPRCTREFCAVFNDRDDRVSRIMTTVTFTRLPKPLFIYDRLIK
jgi:hypothetical protein